MGVYYCQHCDRYKSDDDEGCAVDPRDKCELVCLECEADILEELEAEAEEDKAEKPEEAKAP